MKFTVLGATGFIGRNLLAFLQREGHEVWAPARNDEAIFARPLGHVFYCIGLTADFRSRPFDTVRAHVGVLADILERADFDSFLYMSSTRVYEKSETATEASLLVVDPQDPSELYNLTKLAGESLCRCCGRGDVKIARLSNVIGPDAGSQNFIFDLIRKALKGRIVLQSNVDSSKDYIGIEEVVKLLMRIAVSGKETIYNVANGINLRHGEIVDYLARLTGATVESSPEASLQKFPLISIQRIQKEFGFISTPVLDKLPDLISKYTK